MTLEITGRQRRSVLGIASGLLIVAIITVGLLRTTDGGSNAAPPDSASIAESDLPTQPFELFDGDNASLRDFEGTPLVLNFWASWCPACVAELPEFQAVHEERGDAVAFLGMANADLRPAALDLAGDVGLTYTLADDPDGELFRELGLIAMPSTVFIDAEGEIVEVFAGQLDEAALNARVDDLVAGS